MVDSHIAVVQKNGFTEIELSPKGKPNKWEQTMSLQKRGTLLLGVAHGAP